MLMFIVSETGKVISHLSVDGFLNTAIQYNRVVKTDYGYKVVQPFSSSVSGAGFGKMEVILHPNFTLRYHLSN